MNNLLVAAALLAATVTVAPAQTRVGPGGARYFVYKSDAPPDEVARLYSEFVFAGVALTPEQHARSVDIIKRTRSELVALARANPPDIDPKRTAIRCDQHRELRALLTSDVDRTVFDGNFPLVPAGCGAGAPPA
jgi:hypothetical protein